MEEKWTFLEWRIENFGCWMKAAHGVNITCSGTTSNFNALRVALYPRGESGDGELTELRFHSPQWRYFFGENGDLTFEAPDGSRLCDSRPVNREGESCRVFGPKFEDALSRMKDLHGDHLTVKLRSKKPRPPYVSLRTTLDVLIDTTLQIRKPFVMCPSIPTEVTMVSVKYRVPPQNLEEDMRVIYKPDGEIHLRPSRPKVRISVQCSVSVFSSTKDLVACKKTMHTFQPSVAGSVPVSDSSSAFESGGHSVMRLRIFTGSYQSHITDFVPTVLLLENAPSTGKGDGPFSLVGDLRCLYRDGKSPDIVLGCGAESFPAHRSILRARSPVFHAMLSADMKESESGTVRIEDLDPSALRLFLEFLYTGSFEEALSFDSALKLYYAADKYQVPSLRRECVDRLCAAVSVPSVCRILSLADRHGDERLASEARNFISKNFGTVVESEYWRDFTLSDPLVLLKTVTRFAAEGYFGSVGV